MLLLLANWSWPQLRNLLWQSRSATRSSEPSRLCSRVSLNRSSRSAAASPNNGSARANHVTHSKINRVMAATCFAPAMRCCWPTKTRRFQARWWHRWPFPGDKPKGTWREKAAIISCGRGISFNAPAVCWRPAMWKHLSDRSSIWLPLKAMTAVSPKTFGSMGHPSGRVFNWTKWPFQFFWRINYGVQTAAVYLIRQGPATRQERWEEAGGYSPSTLAVHIAALVCAANFAADRRDFDSERLLLQVADWLKANIEAWTVTNEGTLVAGVRRHYVRLNPFQPGDPLPVDDAGRLALTVNNRAEGLDRSYRAREIVDAGFLDLVRYGIRAADEAIIRDSVRVVDATLKVDTPSGTCCRRYNNDGYGQREDGGPFVGSGKGRGWPLLTGERGHYELASGRDTRQYVRWLEGFATPTHLLPEQVWDEDDRPEQHLNRGRPTGAAVPLLWAHAEYIKLLRSIREGRVFDLIPEVADRYIRSRSVLHNVQLWSIQHPSGSVQRGRTLRIQSENAFEVHFSLDNWATTTNTHSTSTNLGIDYCDIVIPDNQRVSLQFALFWTVARRWEGRDFEVACAEREGGASQ